MQKNIKMKNIIQIQTILMLAFFLSLPFALLSQEETKEKKVRVKTVKEVNGEKIVTDTTFYVSGDDDVKKVVKQMSITADGDSTANVMIDVMVDVESDNDWESDSGKKVIIIKRGSPDGDHEVILKSKIIVIDGDGDDEHVMVYPHCGHKKVMMFKSGDGDEEIIIVSPGSQHKVVKWRIEDDEDFDFDYDLDMEHFEEEMAEMDAEMKEMQIVIMDEQGRLHDEIIEIEHLSELKHLEELEHMKNMEVIVMPSEHHFAPPPHGDFMWNHEGSMEVTDKELREAGVKNKPDRLELDEINIDNEDGVVDLSFVLGYEGTPKVAVYNIYGDKVYSGKPELMNNKYQIKMDLSKKQHGTYYLMIVLGNSSKTMRLKI